MTDLFVSQDGPEIRVCKRDEDGRERVIAYIGSPEGVESPDDWAETADAVLAEWLRYARLFAQAEKMKEALAELVACKDLRDRMDQREIGSLETFDSLADEYTRRKPEAWRRARDVLAELSETNDE